MLGVLKQEASKKEIPNPSTEALSSIEGIKNISAASNKAFFNSSLTSPKKITLVSKSI